MASDCSTLKPGDVLLVVEDEQFLLNYMHRILSRDGYNVLAASNAQDAWDLFQQEAPRVRAVVTDICMPGDWDGLDLVRHVSEVAPDIPVLFVTGYPPPGLLDPGRSLLEKPFTADLLKAAVKRLVGAAATLVGAQAGAA